MQGQNLATFSHSAVTPIVYLQHTPTKHALITVNYALKKLMLSITRLKKLIAPQSTALIMILRVLSHKMIFAVLDV